MVTTNRKLVHGIGINDADYPVQPRIEGKQICCPYYRRWKGLLERVYCPKFKKNNPAYNNVTMCNEWLYFSNFKSWMNTQDWKGKELDKDIIVIGNKHYSADNCCFISKNINCLLNQTKSNKGEYPTGVTIDKERGNRYASRIRIDNRAVFIGWFRDVKDASNAYLKRKAEFIRHHATKQSDERIVSGLLRHAAHLENMVNNND